MVMMTMSRCILILSVVVMTMMATEAAGAGGEDRHVPEQGQVAVAADPRVQGEAGQDPQAAGAAPGGHAQDVFRDVQAARAEAQAARAKVKAESEAKEKEKAKGSEML